MSQSYQIVYEGGSDEIVEKKSRFIAHVFPVHSEEEAAGYIEQIRKKYWDARHNCHAFVIGPNNEISRCSDDGEPQGTAGRPMLDVLLGEEIHNVAVVVTRYFGGTLLGTGGLVRAYSKAVQEGLKNSVIIEKQEGIRLRVQTDYTDIGKIQYQLGQKGFLITDSAYTDVVQIETLVPADEAEGLLKDLTEATSARVKIIEKKPVCFAFANGEPLIFS